MKDVSIPYLRTTGYLARVTDVVATSTRNGRCFVVHKDRPCTSFAPVYNVPPITCLDPPNDRLDCANVEKLRGLLVSIGERRQRLSCVHISRLVWGDIAENPRSFDGDAYVSGVDWPERDDDGVVELPVED